MEFPAAVGTWLEAETARRGLAYLDLSHLVPNTEFSDWTHLGPGGAARVAGRLTPAVARLLGREDAAGPSAPRPHQELQHVPEHQGDRRKEL
jgi:hypothetical protein